MMTMKEEGLESSRHGQEGICSGTVEEGDDSDDADSKEDLRIAKESSTVRDNDTMKPYSPRD